jgi:Skp family chaperone for outer membrane proteins
MIRFQTDRATRLWLAGALLLLGVATGWTQQLTTVAIFDLETVLLSFYQDSAAVREYQEAEREFRAELQRAEQTLTEYQTRRAEAIDRNQTTTARRLREDIVALEEDIVALTERWYARQQELQTQLGGDEFYERLYDTVGFVAQDNGYTAVLESTALGSTALFWYSPDIDITEQIIRELLARFR